MWRDRGMGIEWLATSVNCTPVRSAALNKISLITPGQASASTHMFISCHLRKLPADSFYAFPAKHCSKIANDQAYNRTLYSKPERRA